MMGKTVAGWILVLVTYLVTYLISTGLYLLLFNEDIDADWNKSGLFLGAFLIISPYLVAGMFVRNWLNASAKQALWIAIVPIFAERLIIFMMGALITSDPSVSNSVWLAIRGEFAPYYTPIYVVSGVLSLLVCIIVGKKKEISNDFA